MSMALLLLVLKASTYAVEALPMLKRLQTMCVEILYLSRFLYASTSPFLPSHISSQPHTASYH